MIDMQRACTSLFRNKKKASFDPRPDDRRELRIQIRNT